MKVLVMAAALVVGHFLINSSPAFAQQQLGLRLTAAETRAYHACLFEAWVEDYCRGNSWRPTASSDRVYPACVVANGGGRFPSGEVVIGTIPMITAGARLGAGFGNLTRIHLCNLNNLASRGHVRGLYPTALRMRDHSGSSGLVRCVWTASIRRKR